MKKLFTLAFLAIASLASFAQEQLTIKITASGGDLILDGENTTVNMTKVSESGNPNVYHYSVELNAGTYTATLAGTLSNGNAITDKKANKPSFTLTSKQTVHFWGRIPTNKDYVEGLCSALQYGVMDDSWQYYAMGKPSYNNTTATGYFVNPTTIQATKWKGGVSTKVLEPGSDILTSSGNSALPGTTQGASYSTSKGLKKFEFDYATWTMTVSDATTMDVVITDAKASTLCAPVELTIPDGVKAYKLTYDGSTTLVATPVTTTIPASTPVLLNANAGTYSFAVGDVASEIAIATYTYKDNKTTKKYMETVSEGNLYGVFQEKYVPQNAYVLQNGDSGVGFYKVDVANYAINAFRCYVSLPNADAASAKLNIVFSEDTPAGISNIATAQDNTMFNIAGQRIASTGSATGYKGIVIKNGKKYLNK